MVPHSVPVLVDNGNSDRRLDKGYHLRYPGIPQYLVSQVNLAVYQDNYTWTCGHS